MCSGKENWMQNSVAFSMSLAEMHNFSKRFVDGTRTQMNLLSWREIIFCERQILRE